MLDLIANASLQGLTYGIAALGLALAFRVARYPDLTGDGSFMLGASGFAAVLAAGGHWTLAVMASIGLGMLAGLCTNGLNALLGVNRLLSGILTSMAAYTFAFRLLGGRANVGLLSQSTMFVPTGTTSAAIIIAASYAVAAIVFVAWILRSELGLAMRASGANPDLVCDVGRRPQVYSYVTLALANGLVALAGALVSAQQGFADVNMGVGAIIGFVASLVIGEEIVRRFYRGSRIGIAGVVLSPLLGSILYFIFHLSVLRMSLLGVLPMAIEPTDLKLLSAIIVAAVLTLRRKARCDDQLIPL